MAEDLSEWRHPGEDPVERPIDELLRDFELRLRMLEAAASDEYRERVVSYDPSQAPEPAQAADPPKRSRWRL